MIEEAVRRLQALLHGRVPPRFDLEGVDDPAQRDLANGLNELFVFTKEIHDFIVPLSRGELYDLRVRPGNYLASPFKELHSRLLHLTWQAEQVANGDYGQRVDFMGDFSEAFNSMIQRLAEHEHLLKRKIAELEEALEHIVELEGILPICSNCKKIRIEGGDPKDQESWMQFESYINTKTSAQFSHGICPECLQKLYPDLKSK
ncbi:MAG TPA: hypothetical protein VMV68_03695 [Spirochaetia bacterium]|nr:hypothetical protein [Spirochaetia bacterium]